jgi:hypothetical protein
MRVHLICPALVVTLLASCAPDAWQNVKATGFNAYLDTVGAQCQPLWLGGNQLSQISPDYAGGMGQSNFEIFLDNTSKLYYKRMSAASYRESIQSVFNAFGDPRTNRSIDCIIAKLPADRPSKPSGSYN